MSRLFVSNISFQAAETDLRKLFESFAPSKVILCIDNETGKSKGFGFVEVDDQLAADAITQMDGHEFLSRRVNVQPAREKARK
jgi:RNA recognition motif-containing protein